MIAQQVNADRQFITLSGRRIDLLNPRAEDICIHDICVGMATTNRWPGQTPMGKDPLSCATHSLYVRDYIEQAYPDSMRQFPHLELSALLHDAHKAYLGQQPAAFLHATATKTDVPSQIRIGMKKAIFEHFGLPYPIQPDLRKVIAEAENRITATEIRDFNIPVQTDHEPMIYLLENPSRKIAYDLMLGQITACLDEEYGADGAACA